MKTILALLPNSLTHSYGADLSILVILFILTAVYGLYWGKQRLVSLILAFYPAILLFLNFPYVNNLLLIKATAGQIFVSKCVIFLIFLIPIHLIFNRFVFGDFGFNSNRKFLQAAILSISILILIIVFFYRVVPLTNVYSVSLPLARYLSTSKDFFWWLLVPFVGLFFTR
ncbi:MAG TPA: hypothetical protein VFA52_01500 [Candidatus Paceibacterota bacterium]|nr:hypothetical protein [Candidatus Paceibacterota bacterium]